MYYLRGWKQLIDRVVVFTGSKRDFEQYLTDNLSKDETTIPFMELIQHYNARLRPNESGVSEAALQKKYTWIIALLGQMTMFLLCHIYCLIL